MLTMKQLQRSERGAGRLDWIGLSPRRREPLQVVESAEVRVGTGLVGDHHARGGGTEREVTLIQAEHLPVIAAILGRDEVHPGELRRNLVVSGLVLQSVKKFRFRIGAVLLQGTGDCHPCSRMQENLGPGGYAAMAGHGGLLAKVLTPGTIRLGDPVVFLPADQDDPLPLFAESR